MTTIFNVNRIARQVQRIVIVASVSVALMPIGVAHAAEFITRASSTSTTPDFNNSSTAPAISASGRYVTFISNATNILPDTNSKQQVYVTERLSGEVSLISVDSSGTPGNGDSFQPSISSDGRYIVFASQSSNLSPLDVDTALDVFIHDRWAQTTQLLSRSITGTASGNGASSSAVISADGSSVVFSSIANNIVANDNNGSSDVFAIDRESGEIALVSVDSAGAPANGSSRAPDISANGRFVSFISNASNLIVDDTDSRQDVFVADRLANSIIRANTTADGRQGGASVSLASISGDGDRVAFFGLGSSLVPNVGGRNVYIKTLSTGDISAIDVGSLSNLGDRVRVDNLSLDSTGCKIGFDLFTLNAQSVVLDSSVHVYDCASNTTRSIAQNASTETDIATNGRSSEPAIDSAGRNLVFSSSATNLTTTDTNAVTDIYLLDEGQPCGVNQAGLRRVLKDRIWAMLSLPCEPTPQNATLEIIFDELDIEELGTDWAVFTFTSSGPDANNYVRADRNTVLRPGQGFWIRQDTGSDVEVRMPVDSNEVPVDTTSPVCSASGACFGLSLSGDRSRTPWQILGNPYNASTEFDSIRVTAPEGSCSNRDGCTILAASDITQANLVSVPFFSWDDSEPNPDYRMIEAGESLQPWSAAWVRELANADQNTPTVYFSK